MKKIIPFVFPLAALAIVLFLAFRWYSLRTNRGEIAPNNEGVEIQNLTQEQRESMLKGATDMKAEAMTPAEGEAEAMGQVRYDIQDGQVLLNVSANLPELPANETYQVWLKSADAVSKAFELELNKGGFIGSAAVSEESLPLEITVSQEKNNDEVMDRVLLRATINK